MQWRTFVVISFIVILLSFVGIGIAANSISASNTASTKYNITTTQLADEKGEEMLMRDFEAKLNSYIRIYKTDYHKSKDITKIDNLLSSIELKAKKDKLIK